MINMITNPHNPVILSTKLTLGFTELGESDGISGKFKEPDQES